MDQDDGCAGKSHTATTVGRRIGIVAPGDPDNVSTWSGVPFFILSSLRKQGYEPVWLHCDSNIAYRALRWLDRKIYHIFGRRLLTYYWALFNWISARSIEKQLRKDPVDVILCITNDQSIRLLKTTTPLIHSSDATFDAMIDYYPDFTDVTAFGLRSGHDVCLRAIRNARVSIYPSEWARESAINRYKGDPSQVHVVPYGANLTEAPQGDQVAARLARFEVGPVNLLFVGGEWERKGGPLVLKTAAALNNRGIECCLNIVGKGPAVTPTEPYIRVHGFLRKSDPEQLALYERLWSEATFFILPSRGETFGAVFCEAAARALPAISTDTGGISGAVIDGRTGVLLSLDADGEDYADAIERTISKSGKYPEMVQNSFDRYQTDLNWDVWVKRVFETI